MKITTISILKKDRAPSENVFRKGLGREAYCPRSLGGQPYSLSEFRGTDAKDYEEHGPGERTSIAYRQTSKDDRCEEERFATEKVKGFRLAEGRNDNRDREHRDAHDRHQQCRHFQELDHFDLLKVPCSLWQNYPRDYRFFRSSITLVT